MKKSAAILVLLASLLAVNNALAQTTEGAAAQQKKEIKDPAEYNAYVTALNQQDPNAKAQAFEAYLQQYPNSVVKVEALEVLMATYQQLNNMPKVQEKAHQLLQADPGNLRALALMAYLRRAAAEAGQNPAQNAAEARQFGERGLQALQTRPKPEGMSEEDYTKLRDQTSVIFNGAAGFGALQAKDYKTAQRYFQAAVDKDPNNLRDVYPLAVAYLEDNPPNSLGLWYVARAVNLSNHNAGIVKYGKFKYTKYHGSDEGWDKLGAQAQTSPKPPAGWAVAPAPSPAEQAKILADQKDPKKMDFAEWELILSQGDPTVQEKVWNQIKGIKVPFAAKVINASRSTMSLAATADAIQANQADVEVTMAAPLPVARVPKAGSETQVVAIPESYQPRPFLMKMTEGQLIVQEKAPEKKTPPKRGTTSRRRPPS